MNNLRQAVTAGFNGVVATGVDVGLLMMLVKVGHLQVAPATFLASTVGAVTNFSLNKYLAFRDHSPVSWSQLGRFGVVALVTASILALLMQVVSVWMGVPVLAAKLLCAALVFVAWTYPVQRKHVFKHARVIAA